MYIEKTYRFASKALAFIALCLLCIGASAQESTIRTVPDKGTSGKYFAKLCPMTDVAIDKDSADVFGVYTDGESARFAQGVFQNNKYVIKAGECVIIKTSEEKDVKLEATNARRSSFMWNELICPAIDISLDEFKAEYGVRAGKYIYMLTNLARNGGFGFTHFGGTTLKAGNFYIITTRKPTGSTEVRLPLYDSEKTDVYNLKGEKVKEPKVPGVYVRKGKKFVVK